LAGEPGVVVVDDHDVLLRILRESLVERHIVPLAQATRAHVRVGARILYGSLASSIGYALQVAQDAPTTGSALRGGDLAAYGRAMLDALDLTGLIDLDETDDGTVGVRRHTCCLAFTVPGLGICDTCC